MRIVFVCTGNVCRSALAEALFLQLIADRGGGAIAVTSAGIFAQDGAPAVEGAVNAAAARGIDLSGHRARRFDPASVASGDQVFAMDETARRQVLSLARLDPRHVRLLGRFAPAGQNPVSRDEIDDPMGGPPIAYARCVERLESCLTKLLDWLEEEKISRG